MFSRTFRLPLEAAWFGPLYATVRWRVKTDHPIDPHENWEFWTRARSAPMGWMMRSYPPHIVRSHILRSAVRREHEKGIEYHYDLPKEFFQLFLDREYLLYSCADFVDPQDSLERAQRNKVRSLLDLIEPKAGETILDLGCGWGGMMEAVSQLTGDRENLLGFTLSKKQARYVRNQLGLHVSTKDFTIDKLEPASWDKVYSIGAWEHVRPTEIAPLFRKIHQALKPNGRLIQHFFCLNERGLPTFMITGQVFFPGSLLVSWEEQVEAFHQTGFTIRNHSIHDYRPTLKAWYWNLAGQVENALQIVDLETYNRFLTFFPVAWRFFDEGFAQVHRFVLLKSAETGDQVACS